MIDGDAINRSEEHWESTHWGGQEQTMSCHFMPKELLQCSSEDSQQAVVMQLQSSEEVLEIRIFGTSRLQLLSWAWIRLLVKE